MEATDLFCAVLSLGIQAIRPVGVTKQRMTMEMRKCPVCGGSGKTVKPRGERKSKVADNAVMAKLLHKEGYSLREIQRYLGYKSSRSAKLLIDRKP